MENKDLQLIPYVVLEAANNRNERIITRLIKALVAVTVLLFMTNAAWLIAWNLPYEETGTETVIDGVCDVNGGEGGVTSYIGNDGTVNATVGDN